MKDFASYNQEEKTQLVRDSGYDIREVDVPGRIGNASIVSKKVFAYKDDKRYTIDVAFDIVVKAILAGEQSEIITKYFATYAAGNGGNGGSPFDNYEYWRIKRESGDAYPVLPQNTVQFSSAGNLTVNVTDLGSGTKKVIYTATNHHIISTHTVSGLTIGQVIRATGTSSFAFQQLQHSDLSGVTSDLHHNKVHNSTHITGGDDIIAEFSSATVGLVPSSGGGTTNYLRADGAWVAPIPAVHALGGSKHSADTLVNLNSKISDATLYKWEADQGATNIHGDNVIYGSAASTACIGNDSRLADDRDPNAHVLVNAVHTASGLTTGHTIRATGATTFAWAQLQHSDLGGVSANLHHPETLTKTKGSYVWDVTDTPRSYDAGLTVSFVSSVKGWFSYGTVTTFKGNTGDQDGAVMQIYTPYSPDLGGNFAKIRFGKYNNAGWSVWQVLGSAAGISFGLDNQIPYTNSTIDDFDYSANLTFDGNSLGIGGTNASYKLYVTGGLGLQVYANGAIAQIMVHEDAGTHDSKFRIRRGSEDWYVGQMGSSDLTFTFETSPFMTIDSATGNVGIGTASPLDILHVVETRTGTSGSKYGIKSAMVSDPSGATTAYDYGAFFTIDRKSTNSYNGGYLYAISAQADNSGSGVPVAMTGGAINTRLSGTGNVTNAYGLYTRHFNTGAGTLATLYQLYLDTPYVSAGAITTRYGVYQKDSAALNYFAGKIGINDNTPSYNLDVTGTGRFTGNLTALDFVLGSDIRFKEDIKTLSGLNIALQLNPVTYTRKDNKETNHVGFIAQEVEKVNKNLVREDDKGYKGISYSRITAINNAAIHELHNRFESMKKRMDRLEKENIQLENRIKYKINKPSS